MENDKTPGNDELWSILGWCKNSITGINQWRFYQRRTKYLSKTSDNEINWKKDRDKRFIKNWRLISLLNTDLKLISKALATL